MSIAIGDIHGCASELRELIPKLPEDKALVFLGDYIDRGPDSREVVGYLRNLSKKRECVFLKGNHEDLMLNTVQWPVWFMNGAYSTLQSYGLPSLPVDLSFLDSDLEFFQNLQLMHEDEHAIYVHAGFNLSKPTTDEEAKQQDANTITWVRDPFYYNADNWKSDRLIVFGHTPTKMLGSGSKIYRSGKLVGIDTHCFKSKVLSAFDAETGEEYYSNA